MLRIYARFPWVCTISSLTTLTGPVCFSVTFKTTFNRKYLLNAPGFCFLETSARSSSFPVFLHFRTGFTQVTSIQTFRFYNVHSGFKCPWLIKLHVTARLGSASSCRREHKTVMAGSRRSGSRDVSRGTGGPRPPEPAPSLEPRGEPQGRDAGGHCHRADEAWRET